MMEKQTKVLEKVFNSGTLESKFVNLNEEQANAFLDFVVNESKLLSKVRVQRMTKPNMPIPVLVDAGRFMKPGTTGVAQGTGTYQKFNHTNRTLSTKIVKGAFSMTDEELMNNIEGENLTNHIIGIVTRKVRNELEEIALYGRLIHGASETPASCLDQFNGLKYYGEQEGNVVDMNDTGLFADRYAARNKFTKMYKSLKTKYREDASWFTPSDLLVDYQELFETSSGDSTIRSDLKSNILGLPINKVPLMKVDEPIAVSGYTPTAVNGATLAGATSIIVDSVTGLAVGNIIALDLGSDKQILLKIATISTLTLTFDAAYNEEYGATIPYAVADNTVVTKVAETSTDSFLMNPANLVV